MKKDNKIGYIILPNSRSILDAFISDGKLMFCPEGYSYGYDLYEFKKFGVYVDNKCVRDEVQRIERDFNLHKILNSK